MASVLKVDTIKSLAGNEAMTIHESGVPLLQVPAFQVRKTLSDQTFAVSGTQYVLTYDTVEVDTNSWWDSVNHRYTPQIAGWYQINSSVGAQQSTTTAAGRVIADLRKNGATYSRVGYGVFYNNVNITTLGSTLVYLNGSTDYIDIFALITGAGTRTVWGSTVPSSTFLSGFLVRGV
jgi:hypothetical protein